MYIANSVTTGGADNAKIHDVSNTWNNKVPRRVKAVPQPREPERKKHGFGKRIAEARKDAGLSQKALMDKLDWPNDSNSRLSGYENETRQPSVQDFERIAVVLKVNPCRLAFGHYTFPEEGERVASTFLNADEGDRAVIRAVVNKYRKRQSD